MSASITVTGTARFTVVELPGRTFTFEPGTVTEVDDAMAAPAV
jgi:hypothetical protein